MLLCVRCNLGRSPCLKTPFSTYLMPYSTVQYPYGTCTVPVLYFLLLYRWYCNGVARGDAVAFHCWQCMTSSDFNGSQPCPCRQPVRRTSKNHCPYSTYCHTQAQQKCPSPLAVFSCRETPPGPTTVLPSTFRLPYSIPYMGHTFKPFRNSTITHSGTPAPHTINSSHFPLLTT